MNLCAPGRNRLDLICREFAAKLFIAPETVKKHLKNIYAKLKVTGRQQAVEKARMLGNILRTGM
jgi:LuxR family maltose regulon positive regulatory protein